MKLYFKIFLIFSFTVIRVYAEEPVWFSVFDPKNPRAEFESEHRAQKIRQYRIFSNGENINNLEGYHIDAAGNMKKLEFEKSGNFLKTSISTPWEDGPLHGPNLLYAVNYKVVKNVLVVRTAKWLTINHSCAWGHNHKFDSVRQQSGFFEKIPLEIVPPVLWDTRFHSTLKSGDPFKFQIRHFGKTIPEVPVKIETSSGWQKNIASQTDGTGEFQVIRDYYSSSWKDFNRNELKKLMLTAVYEKNISGYYNGSAYHKIKYITTFSWKYSPARNDYSSLIHGLYAAGAIFILSILMVFVYRERRRKPQREIYLK